MLGVDRVSTPQPRPDGRAGRRLPHPRRLADVPRASASYQFERWAQMIGRPDLLDDERFKDDLGRGDNGEALSAYMAAWCADRTTDECLAEMDAQQGARRARPVAPAAARPAPRPPDRHPRSDVEYPTADEAPPLAGFPAVLSASPGAIRSRAPQLGEHTDEILGALGYDDAAIDRCETPASCSAAHRTPAAGPARREPARSPWPSLAVVEQRVEVDLNRLVTETSGEQPRRLVLPTPRRRRHRRRRRAARRVRRRRR